MRQTREERDREAGEWRRLAAVAIVIFLASFFCGLFFHQNPWEIASRGEAEENELLQEDQGTYGESSAKGESDVTPRSNANPGPSASSGESPAGNGTARGNSSPGFAVCLDPGHADTPFQIDPETGLNTQDWANEPEMSIVFDIALRAKGILESKGVRVVMTKSSLSSQVNLKQRALIANQCGAYLVVHIHTDPGISSPTTFFPGPSPNNWKANSQTGRKAYIDPSVQTRSQQLAGIFHSAMSATLQRLTGSPRGSAVMENRGATGTGNYGPLLTYDVWSRIPTFTLENNQSFANSHRQEIAQGIADGVMACLGK